LAFSAQGSRVIIVAVHVRAMKKLYSSIGDAPAKGKRGDEEEMNAVYHKIDGFLSFTPP
jgi:hypothetical protein